MLILILCLTGISFSEKLATNPSAALNSDSLPYQMIKIKKGDSFYKLFKNKWQIVARFNRLDEKHLIIGEKIKVPENLQDINEWTPMPKEYPPAEQYKKYILISLKDQFLGFYQNGKLVFDAPISSGRPKERCDSETGDCSTPTGLFYALGGDKNHKSSIYKNPEGEPFPMDWAIRFYVNKNGIQFWIHKGNLPGYPASHGCVRLTMKDARKLFRLVFEKYPEGEFWINKKKVYIPVEIIP